MRSLPIQEADRQAGSSEAAKGQTDCSVSRQHHPLFCEIKKHVRKDIYGLSSGQVCSWGIWCGWWEGRGSVLESCWHKSFVCHALGEDHTGLMCLET